MHVLPLQNWIQMVCINVYFSYKAELKPLPGIAVRYYKFVTICDILDGGVMGIGMGRWVD